MPRSIRLALVTSLVAVASCADAPAAPELEPDFGESPFENCNTSDGIRVCLEWDQYSPGEMLPFTVANGLDRSVFHVRCGGGVEGMQFDGEWGSSYGVRRACAIHETTEDVQAGMVPLPRGGVVFDTLFVNSQAFNGDWRVWVSVVTSEVAPISPEPPTSPVFRVRASAAGRTTQ